MKNLLGKLFLAPMAETSTPALRRVIKEFSQEVVLYSEMLSAGAIAAKASHNEPMDRKYDFDDPYIYQIVGSNPHVMAEACAILSGKGCYAVDINMGCPNHDIVKRGQGAWLLTDLEKAKQIIRSCRKATRARLSVKMRTGWDGNDENNFVDFIAMLENEGVDFITVHPRYAKLGFRRTADWRLVALAKSRVSIPIIGNGDIDTPEAGIAKLMCSGCDGIMIGREAVKSPWIFKLISDLLSDRANDFTVDVRETFLRTLGYIKQYLPERLHRSRCHRFCAYYAKNVYYGHELFTMLRKETSICIMQKIIHDYFLRNPHEAVRQYQVKKGDMFEIN